MESKAAAKATRPIPWPTLIAFYGEGVILSARWAGRDLEVETERGTDLWPDGEVEAVMEAMTRIVTEFRQSQAPSATAAQES